jgi:hypothetical protein
MVQVEQTSQTVLTVSFITPLQAMPFDEELILLGEALCPMMFFLSSNVASYPHKIGVGNGKCPVSFAPSESSLY